MRTCPEPLSCYDTESSLAAKGHRTQSVPMRLSRRGTRGQVRVCRRGVIKDRALRGLHGEVTLEKASLGEQKRGRAFQQGGSVSQGTEASPGALRRSLGGCGVGLREEGEYPWLMGGERLDIWVS